MARSRTSSVSGLLALVALFLLIKYYWLIPLVVVVLIIWLLIRYAFRKSSSPAPTAPRIEITSRVVHGNPNEKLPFELPAPPQTKWLFHTSIAGVSHRNADGSSREEVAAECEPGEFLTLLAEPDNPVDPNAVRVFRDNGKQLGYLKRHVAAEIAGNHWPISSLVTAVTEVIEGDDGDEAKTYYQVNVLFGRRE